ncbi:MAG: adenylate/guanylate cyclase domain-containing protein, partial [Pseudomonadota bacterium]
MTDTGGIVQSEDASDSRVVTLVFTDIEGSTRLVDSLGADYADVLSRHQELIRGIVAKYNGMDRGTQGDSFFLVYDDPRDALATAIEIHRGLNTRTWHKDVQVGVRIGLHTGEVTFLRSEIVGLNVHRAARVCDAGHGGQIVVTQDVQTAVGDTTGLGFSFEPLGRHRLKDLRYPEVLFGVKASGLDRDFKPVRSLDSRHDNLTPLQTTIVGRDTELETLRDLLDNHTGRLLTLLGPGGIGKSSIAHRLAEIERDAFPHGVHFVDLSGVSEPEFVFPSIAQAIGVRDFPNRPLEDDIVGDIGVNRRLLVLDTMEHLLEARTAVGHLIDRCPQLRIVVTSRSALGLNSEKLVRVGALELPEPGQPDADQNPAVRLFVNRILEADPDFKPTPETLDTIVRIVRRLEGVPLAMELAAARLILLSPGELLARLDERFKLLRSSSKDVARHRTLRGAIEWSDELLDEEERDAFHRLAVFAGGFRFRDGEDVLEGVDGYAGDPMDLIASLVSKSLIERSTSSGEPRFVMLDMIREFAIEKLQKGGAHDEMQALHCDHYADIAEKSGANALRHDQRVHVTKLVEEVDNIRAALHYSLEIEDAARVARFLRALQWYWFTQAQVTEAFTWTARAADLAARTPDKVSAGIIHEAVCTVNMGAG